MAVVNRILFFYLLCSVFFKFYVAQETEFELHPQDGYYNNPIHPDWGAIDDILLRRSPADYSDGVYLPAGEGRPNPFAISLAGHHGQPGLGSTRNITAFTVYYGQQIVEEIMDAQRPGCPREFFNIPVRHEFTPSYDPSNQGDIEMPFIRARFDQRTGKSPNNPRQQLNENTPFLDGTLIYGPAKTWTDAIREFSETRKGRLKALDPAAPIASSLPALNSARLPFANPPPPREHQLKPVSRFWVLGNPRGNENPFLLAFGILWFRYHNFVADDISSKYPHLDDEAVFNLARKKVIAVYQNIVMYDWVPTWLGISSSDIQPYCRRNEASFGNCTQYNPNIHPGITQEFQVAAMRFGHTLVTPGTWLRGKPNMSGTCAYDSVNTNIPGQPRTVHALRTCNSYWNGQDFLTTPEAFENMLMGLASTIAEREDNIVVPDLREHLFGPLEFSRRDLVAINIQRARDHGVPDYNTVRKAYGLPEKDTWESINTATYTDPANPGLYTNGYMTDAIQRVKEVYGNTSKPDNLDLFSGGLLESTPDGPGELFTVIMLEQFLRIRQGDRFWYENTDNGLFTDAEIAEIRNTRMIDVVLNVTTITASDINANPFVFAATDPCPQPAQLMADSDQYLASDPTTPVLENCTALEHYDYFSGSEYSFAFTYVVLALSIPGTIIVMFFLAKRKERRMEAIKERPVSAGVGKMDEGLFPAVEWTGPKEGERNVKVKLDSQREKVFVMNVKRKVLRVIDLRNTSKVHIFRSSNNKKTLISVRVPEEIDLVLRFSEEADRNAFVCNFEDQLKNLSINVVYEDKPDTFIYKDASTKEERQKLLEKFIRVVGLKACQNTPNDLDTDLGDEDAYLVSKIQLTRREFAEALGMKPSSEFVRSLFNTVDKDNNGLIGFQEFMDMFSVLCKGSADEKAKVFFKMYDPKGKGELTQETFKKMIRSMLDYNDSEVIESDLDTLVQTLLRVAGVQKGQNVTWDHFRNMFASGESETTLIYSRLPLNGRTDLPQAPDRNALQEAFAVRKKTFIDGFLEKRSASDVQRQQRPKSAFHVTARERTLPDQSWKRHWITFTRYVGNYKRQIFWGALFVLVTIGIFLERVFYFSYEREHVGLRRVTGYGVSITRGAASVMMWTYSCLLLTMARNIITFFRETVLHRFIPFDSAHDFHAFIAAIAIVGTVTHVIGHGFNLYHINTWASGDLNCVFREYFRATHILANFHYWAWTTITGITGIVLTLIVIVMVVFAVPFARRHLYQQFQYTHALYILLYLFLILHGAGRLVQTPLMQNFLIGPLVVYIFDKLISLSRRKLEISVKKALMLPSDVFSLTFKRPHDFEYRSGQWVRIACKELGSSEYHPFTLTSSPNEENLTLHIRAVGPWTMNMRNIYDENNRNGKPFSKILLDGPFGEGHQDWYKSKVAVLIGGGIGVTPFASILKDIVYRSRESQKRPYCEKVYFLWVTRTQKQFEWMTEIVKEVEEADLLDLVNVQIFITQFQQKFDLRTTMLYICERNFYKESGKSLFTGLKATTHFGRPDFEEFFKAIHSEHPSVAQIGVFSCGPPPMTSSVHRACANMNKVAEYPTFTHHYENF